MVAPVTHAVSRFGETRIRSSHWVNHALHSILLSFVGLLVSVTIRFGLNVPRDMTRVLLAGGTFTALLLNISLIYPVLAEIAVSLLLL